MNMFATAEDLSLSGSDTPVSPQIGMGSAFPVNFDSPNTPGDGPAGFGAAFPPVQVTFACFA